MTTYKITLDLWQWACLVDCLRKMLESFTTWPLPDQYKGLERAIESIIRKYLAAHDTGLKDGTISPMTKGPALLLIKKICEEEFSKEMAIELRITEKTQFGLESYFQGMIKALKNAPESPQDAEYEQTVKDALQSILNQFNAPQQVEDSEAPPPPKVISYNFMRETLAAYDKSEITFSRMVELINQEINKQ